MAENSRLEQLLEQGIQAQNRTTHAVRAIATYFLIQVAWSLVGGFFIGLGIGLSSEGSGLWVGLGAIMFLVGFFHAFSRAMSELNNSVVPSGAAQAQQALLSSTSSAGGSSSNAAAKVAQTKTPSDPRWSDDDWVNAQRLLTYKEMTAWDKAGRPSLAKWVELGSPPISGWLQNGPFN